MGQILGALFIAKLYGVTIGFGGLAVLWKQADEALWPQHFQAYPYRLTPYPAYLRAEQVLCDGAFTYFPIKTMERMPGSPLPYICTGTPKRRSMGHHRGGPRRFRPSVQAGVWLNGFGLSAFWRSAAQVHSACRRWPPADDLRHKRHDPCSVPCRPAPAESVASEGWKRP